MNSRFPWVLTTFIFQKQKKEQENWQRDQPEVEPPALRAAPNDRVKQQGEQRRSQNRQQLYFEPVACPGAPRLNRDSISLEQNFIEDVERQLKQGNGHHQKRNVDHHLEVSFAARRFGAIPKLCRISSLEDEPQNEHPIEKGKQPK